MTLPEEGILLRIYISEQDKHEGVPLSDWIVRAARESSMAGATVIRGQEGYGAGSQIHTTHILSMADDLPVLIEIVDTVEKIQPFVTLLDGVIKEGLVTQEKVKIHFYRSREKQ